MRKIYPVNNYNLTGMRYDYSTPPYQSAFRSGNMNSNYTIKATGKGEVSVKPDQSFVLLGSVVENMKVQTAQTENAIISNKMIEALKGEGIKQEEIETNSYTIDRIVDYQDSQQIFKGYRVSHIFKVIVKDLANVGKVIDVAVENGANEVRNLTFEIANPEPYYGEALQKATLNAKMNAENIAKSLGLSINNIPIWMSDEGIQVVRPMSSLTMTAAAFSGPTTPIQEGQIKITASVQAMFNYVSY
ncbi:SIMPL domain-containing protein [Gottfriedia acidiceleris]|uniref:SIMPL domain-containing protein n=1 Tax=Gottfriedia acidiceleris TaxID=371036 RepID=A0ABY4JFK2_9BACI|nr:SIMPL domain-containing protein [Gottfriedia acidiceleris]UPM52603.1 SIMPL domain-containing protein [Gottfriedia acidiceleris]